MEDHAEIMLDEIWLARDDLSLERRQHETGIALARKFTNGISIEATTDIGRPQARKLAAQLLELEVLESHRDAALDLVRRHQLSETLILRTVFAHTLTGESELFRAVIRIARRDDDRRSVLTTPAHLEDDLRFLIGLDPIEAPENLPSDDLPTLWVRGAGGVLLHEAAGHPAGISSPARWPDWLRVTDAPHIELFEKRLRGPVPRAANLLEEPPESVRRATFRDHPLRRLSSLVVSAERPPLTLPQRYVEISMTAGGGWDPLHDTVTVNVCHSWLVDGEERRPLAPFVFSATRSRIASALVGAGLETDRYRGVLCSEQGQWIPVGTFSPDLLLESCGE